MMLCPLCSVSLTASSLEAHLRQELLYPALCCLLCREHFTSDASAHSHFLGPLAKHPGQQPALLRLDGDEGKEARLVELVRMAEGGRREVDKRLCVCGQCQLLCREDFRYTSDNGQGAGEQIHSQEGQANYQTDSQQYYAHQAAVEPQAGADFGYGRPDYEPPIANQSRVNLVFHPPPEPSEQESLTARDIKPDLKDLKPQINRDGKVACVQCGLRIAKESFKSHALTAHSSVRLYNCNLCPHSEKLKAQLASHLRKSHGTSISEETFTFAGSEGRVDELVEQCFGAAKNVDWARMKCQPCDQMVNKMSLKNHIAKKHLKKTLHSCKLCDYAISDLSAGNMNVHVKRKHKKRPGPETIDSSAVQKYEPVIKNMIPQIFTQG